MLSIIIPVKDYDCCQLIEELHRQGEALGYPFEIILGEDGTSADNLKKNVSAEFLGNCRRIIRAKSIGRANTRNTLALEARYKNLLFIDSDAVVEKTDFLQCYINALKENEVVCGGLYHVDKLPDKSCTLRYKYEKKADKHRDAATRNKAPYDKFTTFNFAIRRELFTSIFFNPSITRYGHEDTLFGKELERRGHKILHIDNSLLHNGLESNILYLSKVEQSLVTLKEVSTEIGSTPLLDTVARLRRWHLTSTFRIAWKITRGLMKKNLTGNRPSLMILNLYKLGYYISLK